MKLKKESIDSFREVSLLSNNVFLLTFNANHFLGYEGIRLS